MANLYTEVSKNVTKTWIFLSGFLVLIIGLGWIFAQAYQDDSILYIAVVFSTTMSIVSYWFSDKIVLSISHARPIEKKDNPELYRLVENLSITAGLPTPKVYIIETQALNAFATGRDKDHAVIAVTSGLLARMEKKELEGVLAHEMSHIGNRDILISTVVVVLAGVVSTMANIFLRMRFRGRRSEGGSHPIFLVIAIIAAILAPIAATLIKLAISRKREFLADASAALLTRYPDGLIGALEKLHADEMPMPYAGPATSHLYIDEPMSRGEQKGTFFAKMFMTHPPIAERIAALRQMKI
jgi:heat shock protein HtpX